MPNHLKMVRHSYRSNMPSEIYLASRRIPIKYNVLYNIKISQESRELLMPPTNYLRRCTSSIIVWTSIIIMVLMNNTDDNTNNIHSNNKDDDDDDKNRITRMTRTRCGSRALPNKKETLICWLLSVWLCSAVIYYTYIVCTLHYRMLLNLWYCAPAYVFAVVQWLMISTR